MQDALRDRLQATLGSSYTVQRELGGGGMSRVFVADETALNRSVVIKLLPPDLAAGVSVDRFKREIQVAAAIHHPHIVPVLTAGETDGLPFYTMPFVEGESLRQKLARGPLPIAEAVSVLRDVAKALAFAHEHGIVHRDIKPDNVMVTGTSAAVTDFGIAKAVSASRLKDTGATLTQMGTSIGTPAYMSPEQAAGDPDTDHRTDIYSFGAMAYELLGGQPPFHGLPPIKLLAAQMTERPNDLAQLRPEVPAGLSALVMQCLEKQPGARPQSATALAQLLDGLSGSSGTLGAMPDVLLGGRSMLTRALAFWALASLVVILVARIAIVEIGLPDWVFPGAIVLMALGLPAILFTGYVQRTTHKALTTTPAVSPSGATEAPGTLATLALKAAPVVNWRRTMLGGVYSGGAFVGLVAIWMVLRALGIGPAGSLMAAGKMGKEERVILAEFRGPATDSLLGPTVTEALRTDLSQSANLIVMPTLSVREALQRMQRSPETRVDFAVAREIATREGIKAVIDGEVVALGGSYVLSARLVTAQSGEELAAFRTTAESERDIIPAISKLTKQLRSKVGESLRSVQRARSLDKVTTPSLEALQKYVAGYTALEVEGDFQKGSTLLEEAIVLDSGFAMAYRKLAVEMNNRGIDRPRVWELLQKAYDNRDRLSDVERYLTVASYFSSGPTPDRTRVISAYESLLDIDPENRAALNNLSLVYTYDRNYARAEELLQRALEVNDNASVVFNNLVQNQLFLGKLDEAQRTVTLAEQTLPGNPSLAALRYNLLLPEKRYAEAEAVMDSLRIARPNDRTSNAMALQRKWSLRLMQGRLKEGQQYMRELRQLIAVTPEEKASQALQDSLDGVWLNIWFRDDKPAAEAAMRRALTAHPLSSLEPGSFPIPRVIALHALLGQGDAARSLLQDALASPPPGVDPTVIAAGAHSMQGLIALAENRPEEAVRELRAGDVGGCGICDLPDIARAYTLANNADSAIALLERFVQSEGVAYADYAGYLAGSYRRLGELYDARGDRQNAIKYLTAFVELWKDADPELQPVVRQARDRIAALQRGEGGL